jgi:hypothetical protein
MAIKNITAENPVKKNIVEAIKRISGNRTVTNVKHDTTRGLYFGDAFDEMRARRASSRATGTVVLNEDFEYVGIEVAGRIIEDRINARAEQDRFRAWNKASLYAWFAAQEEHNLGVADRAPFIKGWQAANPFYN